MTILKNKFYVGQSVYCAPKDKMIEVRKIYDNVDNTKLTYGLSNDRSIDECRYLIVDESVIYESKEAYEKEQNQIRVGDEFYYLYSLKYPVQKKICEMIDDDYIYADGEACSLECCFKTKDQLLAAVKKAVEECE